MPDLSKALDQFYAQMLKPKKPQKKAVRGGRCDAWRKFTSMELSVHPKQVKEANERAKRHGLAVHYDRRGRCFITSPSAMKGLKRLEGLGDQDMVGGIFDR